MKNKTSIGATLTIVMLIAVFSFCKNPLETKKMDIDFSIFQDKDKNTFSFDELKSPDIQWDFVYIASPYSTLDAVPINLSKSEREELKRLAMSDSHYSILFYDNNRQELLFYTRISANTIDLTKISDKEYSKNKIFKIATVNDILKLEE